MSDFIVWSKDNCAFCVQAKNLIKNRGMTYEDRNISQGEWTREHLLEAVPNARTVPQIFLGDRLIGGYEDLKKHFGV